MSVPPGLPPEALELVARLNRPEYVSRDGTLIGRPQVSGVHKGSRFVAVGSRIYFIPPDMTFHDFILRLLVDTIGKELIFDNNGGPHPIRPWFAELSRLQQQPPLAVRGPIAETQLTGDSKALLNLAHDLYSVLHCSQMPAELVRRLGHPHQFQGVRYELVVAALFARAGFTLEWTNDRERQLPEFTATHKISGQQIAVEAKSRHRSGVLGYRGTLETMSVKAGLDRLLKDAVRKQSQGLPFAVYLDANLPLADPNQRAPRRWVGEVQRMLDRYDRPATPTIFSSVTVTNFSWHYEAAQPAMLASEYLLFLPDHPVTPLADRRSVELILTAATQYGNVPSTFEDD